MKTLILALSFVLLSSAAFAGGSIYEVTPSGDIKSWSITDYPITGDRVIRDNQTGKTWHYSDPDRLLGTDRELGVSRSRDRGNIYLMPDASDDGGDD